MSQPFCLGLAGTALAGKDTFFSLLKAHLSGRVVQRFAYADALKAELDPLFRAFGGTAFETDPVKKAAIRPLLVSHGMSQRILTQGRYWVDKVAPLVRESMARGEVAVITDNRFPNEIEYIKSIGGKVMYLERIDENGVVIGPVNREEAENDEALRSSADLVLSWTTERDIHALWPFVERAAAQLGLRPE